MVMVQPKFITLVGLGRRRIIIGKNDDHLPHSERFGLSNVTAHCNELGVVFGFPECLRARRYALGGGSSVVVGALKADEEQADI